MRPSRVIAIIGLILLDCSVVLSARAEDALEARKTTPVRKLSNSVQLNGDQYILAVVNGKLSLETEGQERHKKSSWLIKSSKEGVITQMVLGKWQSSQLVAMIKFSSNGLYVYHCIVFPNGDKDGRLKGDEYYAEPILESEVDLTISSINGEIRGDEVRATFTKTVVENGRYRLDAAVLYFNPCPQPPVGGDFFVLKGERLTVQHPENGAGVVRLTKPADK